MDPAKARQLWQRFETINAVAYFAPECIDGAADLGLKGFWMGYFACRAAPMGPVGPGVVDATFFNFHPSMVHRAIPDAWSFARPAAILEMRHAAAAAALRARSSKVEALAEALARDLQVVVERAGPEGRPLFAANQALPVPDDPVAALWLACTCLREHRGDGHVAALAAAGLDGCEVHVLFAAAREVPSSLYQNGRGWSVDDWAAATERLEGRGLVAAGFATDAGLALHHEIESTTDRLAAEPFDALAPLAIGALTVGLHDVAAQIHASAVVRYPNPMGLPPLT